MGMYQMDGINDINAAERLQILGSFQIIEKDLLGNVLNVSEHKNLITNKFKAAVADSLTGDYDADKCTIGYIAVGTDDTAANATDTALGNQVGANKAYVTDSRHNDTAANKAEATFFFDSTESDYYATWAELGVYATNGTDLLTHTVLSPTKTFNNTKTITINYTFTF